MKFDDHEQNADIAALEVHAQSQVAGRVRNLRVVLQEHGLILYGQSRTYHGKQLAQEAVMASSTRPILANEIEVI
jgi:hypothetical protein